MAARLAAMIGRCLFRGDDQAHIHDAHPDTRLRRKSRLLQPQSAKANPGKTKGKQRENKGTPTLFLSLDKHISLGGGAFFNYCFPFFDAKIVFNPGLHFSTSMRRPEFAFCDIDGDSYVDVLASD